MGATSHFVAVPADRAEQPVREFEAFTADLYRLADWLAHWETVVMECGTVFGADRGHGVPLATGFVYWIPCCSGCWKSGTSR